MGKKIADKKRVFISINVTPEVAEKLKQVAGKQDRSVSSLMRRIVEKYMADGGANE